MPNWCKGTLKVRGTFENVKKFFLEGMEPVSYIGETREFNSVEANETHLWVTNGGDDLWLRDSRRHFCSPEYVNIDVDSPDDIVVMKLPFKAAWKIDTDTLQSLCLKFNVDMKIQGFECGMQFSQIVEIVNKKIVQDRKIKYVDWDWDCPCPNMGG